MTTREKSSATLRSMAKMQDPSRLGERMLDILLRGVLTDNYRRYGSLLILLCAVVCVITPGFSP